MSSKKKGVSTQSNGRLLPPEVVLPDAEASTSLATKIIDAIAQVTPGEASAITEQELEECVAASAIVLCWHLASIKGGRRRGKLLRKLWEEKLDRVLAIEAAGIASTKGISIDDGFRELKRAFARRGDVAIDEAETAPSEPAKSIVCAAEVAGPISMVMPPWTSIGCCNLVNKLIQCVAERGPSFSDEETELRARACHSAMYWFVEALDDDPAEQSLVQRFWMVEIPKLVFMMITVSIAEETGSTVLETAADIGEVDNIYQQRVGGGSWAEWVGEDGTCSYSGPHALKNVMTDFAEASDMLRAVSHVVGVDVNALDSEELDTLLGNSHAGLVLLVPDGSERDVSAAEYEALIRRFGNMSDEELVEGASRCLHDEEASLVARSIRRSFLVRAHMMRVKLDDRQRREAAVALISNRSNH
jgi:hypothetical protein